MLAGAYPSDEFAELKPRVVWDRVTDVVEGRRDARVVAVTSGGTIPDRGLYPVFLEGEAGTPGRRVGELDEEMVYELRAGMHGDVVVLGASSWRVAGHQPQPGHRDAGARASPASSRSGTATPSGGRSSSGGRSARSPARSRRTSRRGAKGRAKAADAAARPSTTSTSSPPRTCSPTSRTSATRPARCRPTAGSSSSASATSSATGGSSSSRRSAAGSTRRGRWRSRAGSRSAWGSRSRRSTPTTGSRSACPRATRALDGVEALLFPDPEEVEDLVVGRVGQSSLFASRFRENAARALLLPRRRPGTRTPLWQQRQRAADLLQRREPLRELPDPRRDVPRVPRRRVRPAGAARGAGRRRAARDRRPQRRDREGVGVRGQPAVRLRRGVHVRRRRPARRAAGPGADARPRPPPRAAGPGGAARAARRRTRSRTSS